MDGVALCLSYNDDTLIDQEAVGISELGKGDKSLFLLTGQDSEGGVLLQSCGTCAVPGRASRWIFPPVPFILPDLLKGLTSSSPSPNLGNLTFVPFSTSMGRGFELKREERVS